MLRFTSISFHNFKRFKSYSIALNPFSILVGVNNSGKSTVIQAFRMLAEGIRRAKARRPELIPGPFRAQFGYRLNLKELAVATENVFTDYDDTQPALIRFRVSNGNYLVLHFPAPDTCNMFSETPGRPVSSPAQFRAAFDCDVAFVPVLGPLEHRERMVQREAARLALISHRASRNFRNIWYHFPDAFDEFRALLETTWPGASIDRPTLNTDTLEIDMFCREERITREIGWMGFGFQVWCQMLTFIVAGQSSALLALDEPDIYLHSNLQRQLIHLLRNVGPDILLATHSTEMMAEAEPSDIVIMTREHKSGRRLKNVAHVHGLFESLGSSLNPVLTQLAKTKRALFVEGDDFAIVAALAGVLGQTEVENRGAFTVLPANGFNPARVSDMSDGIEAALGAKLNRAAVFDRDYRCAEEVAELEVELGRVCSLVHIHDRKEIENYLLAPGPIRRAIEQRLKTRKERTGDRSEVQFDVEQALDAIAARLRLEVHAQYVAHHRRHHSSRRKGIDEAALVAEATSQFEDAWKTLDGRLGLCSGKQVLRDLNSLLMNKLAINVSAGQIARAFTADELPMSMRRLINGLARFAASKTP